MFDLAKITDVALRKMVEDEIARVNQLKVDAETKLATEVTKSADLSKQLGERDEQIAKFKPVDPFANLPEDIRKQLKDQADEIAKMKAAGALKDAEVLVKSLVGDFPCDVTAVAKTLVALNGEQRQTLESVLKSVSAVSAKVTQLTKESGIGGAPPIGADTAEAKLNAIAKAYLDQKICTNMADALQKAISDNKELAREYVSARQRR